MQGGVSGSVHGENSGVATINGLSRVLLCGGGLHKEGLKQSRTIEMQTMRTKVENLAGRMGAGGSVNENKGNTCRKDKGRVPSTPSHQQLVESLL